MTVVTLALGIGCTAAIFSVADWALFRANEYPRDVYFVGGQNEFQPFSTTRLPAMVKAYEEQTNVMSEYAKVAFPIGNLVVGGRPIGGQWLKVSANFFSILGIRPALGRDFLKGEDSPGRDQVVLISGHFWRTELGARADVLGTHLTVGDSVCTIVGVLPDSVRLPPYFIADVYQPLFYSINPARSWDPTLMVLGRLRAGVTRERATLALSRVKLDLPASDLEYYAKDRPALASLPEVDQWFRHEIYWVLLGAVGFLYAIACVNASNLILVRLLGQQRELCIRLALGGGRARLVRMLAVESLVLGFLSALGGLVVANWVFPLLLAAAGAQQSVPGFIQWSVTWRVAGFLGSLAICTSLLVVLVPAWKILRTEINAGLKEGGAAVGESRGMARMRGSFVVLQSAFAVVLLTGAGLMIHTFQVLRKVDLGFDPEGRVAVQITFPDDYLRDRDIRLARLREIQADLMHVPGVRAVGFSFPILLTGFYYPSERFALPGGGTLKAAGAVFNVGYQEASGIVLKRGRWLAASAGNEVMVNETFARALWPGQNPVGQMLKALNGGETDASVVVGVVGDIRTSIREAPGAFVYWPEKLGSRGMNQFVLRLARDDSGSLEGLIRQRLYAFDPRMVVTHVTPLTKVRDNQLWAERLTDAVLKILAAVAALLTVVGIFSVVTFTVSRRMHEFGVRLALGATSRDLATLVIRRGLVLTLLGTAAGIGAAVCLGRFLRSLLFGTTPNDPGVLAAVALALIVSATVACLLPARRATRADITRLLRAE